MVLNAFTDGRSMEAIDILPYFFVGRFLVIIQLARRRSTVHIPFTPGLLTGMTEVTQLRAGETAFVFLGFGEDRKVGCGKGG